MLILPSTIGVCGGGLAFFWQKQIGWWTFLFKCLNLASVQPSATHAELQREHLCFTVSHWVQGLEFVENVLIGWLNICCSMKCDIWKLFHWLVDNQWIGWGNHLGKPPHFLREIYIRNFELNMEINISCWQNYSARLSDWSKGYQ